MFPGRLRPSSSWLLAALTAALATACAGPPPDPERWERPVDGAAGVTEWESVGTPSSAYGPDGFAWESADQLMESLAASLEAQGVAVEHAVIPGDEADLFTGWLRITNPDEDPSLAADLRLRIEPDDGSWAATRVEERRHCRFEMRGNECTEPGRPEPVETSPPVESAAPSQTSDGGVYLALGDSVTFGIGVARPRDNGFVAQVADALAGATPPIAETRILAVPGETAVGFRDRRLDDAVTAIAQLGPRIRLVTIGLGANDVLRIRRVPPCDVDPAGDACRALVDAAIAEAAGALDDILDTVRTALVSNNSAAAVVVLAYYLPDADPAAAAPIIGSDGVVACDPNEPRRGLNDRIACVADARNAILVDLYAKFLGRETELTRIEEGDVHPNAAGYAVIAEAILEAIEDR